MINHQDQFNRLEGSFDSLSEIYKIFSKEQNQENRDKVLYEMKEFREQLSNFTASIKNIYFGGGNK